MSLLTFFATQRRRWQQAAVPTADFQAGGLAALDQAETAFRTLPLHNAHEQNRKLQQELEEVSYELVRARAQLRQLQAALTKVQAAAIEAPKWHQRRAYRARKTLRKIAEAANHPLMRPDTKLRKIQEVANRFLANLDAEEPEVEPAGGEQDQTT